MRIKIDCFTAIIVFLTVLALPGCDSTPVDDDTNGGAASTFTVFHAEDGLANDAVEDIAVDYIFDGAWFATRKGFSFYSNTDSTMSTYGPEYTGIPSVKGTSVALDYTGAVWVGTESGAAYYSVNDTTWLELQDMGNLAHRFITVIKPMDDFSLWIGTRGGVSVLNAVGAWKSYTAELGNSWEVTAIERDSVGNTWIGTTNGISVYDGESWITYGSSVLPSTYINAVFKDASGTIWCGTASIITAYDGVSWTNYGPADGLTLSGINDFAQDNDGTLWAAANGGVFYFSGNKWNALSMPAELTGATVTALAMDRMNGILWIGTLSGVARYTFGTP